MQQYALIGGFAVSAWGIPRATQDIDFAIAVGSADPLALATFLNARYQGGEPGDPLHGVLQVTIKTGQGSVSLQLIILPAALTELVFSHVVSLSVLNCTVPVVSWQMLVILKLYAGGPQDMIDVQQILKVRRPNAEEVQAISSMAETAGVLDEWKELSRKL